jgi:thymidylate kinase
MVAEVSINCDSACRSAGSLTALRPGPSTLWIGLEGIGGSGKTTQMRRLGRALRQRYPDRVVAADSEFGDSPLGTYVSDATGNGRLRLAFPGADTGHVRHLLALAARADKLQRAARGRSWQVMLLDSGTAVDAAHALADLPAAAGTVRRWLREAVESLLAPAAEAIGPGVTLFLACRPEVAAERLAARLRRRPTDVEVAFLHRLADAYEEVLDGQAHVIRIDAEPVPDEVTSRLLTALKPLLG